MYGIYYTDNCNTTQYNNKAFASLADAKAYCDLFVIDDMPYNHTDTPNTNNHYHLEVYDTSADISITEPLYCTSEYYKY